MKLGVAVVSFVVVTAHGFTHARAEPGIDDPIARCQARRLELERAAERELDPSKRARITESLPHCSTADTAGAALAAPSRPNTPSAARTFPRLALEFELGAGGGGTAFVGSGVEIGGGIGAFVNRHLELSARIAGLIGNGGTGATDMRSAQFLGVLGPHVDLWLGRFWLGFGGGVAFASCGDCNLAPRYGVETRVGGIVYQWSSGGLGLSLAFQYIGLGSTTSPTDRENTGALSLQLGVQTF